MKFCKSKAEWVGLLPLLTTRTLDQVAFCEGRTLIDNSNVWLHNVAAMDEESECVKHALLSMAATYVLDYAPSDQLKMRANVHHKRAVALLGVELAKMGTYKPGGEEVALCALSILNQEDVRFPKARSFM